MTNAYFAELVKIHRNSDELDFKKIWNEGLFIFDANVFLDLYRLPQSASSDLMKVFSNREFKPRIWTGFQVAIEFLSNRHEAISDQKNKFHKVKSLVDNAINEQGKIIEILRSELAELKLKKRHSLINPDIFLTRENIDRSIKYLKDFSAELERLEREQFDVNEHDAIKQFVLNIFGGCVDAGLSKRELEDIYKEGEKRYEKEIPPGFKDIKKKGSYFHQDREYIQRYGDLVFWKEIIKKAQEGKYKYIVLVTGDVKEDWWIEKRGKKLGPRKELLNEIYGASPELEVFHMYDTSAFLQYAKSYLDANIKESSISEAEDLIKSNRQKRNDGEPDAVSFRSSYIKTLSAVEARPERSNQHEFVGVQALKQLFGTESFSATANFSIRGTDIQCQSGITWYDARAGHATRSEYRLYLQPNPVMAVAQEGDNIVIGFDEDNVLHFVLVKSETSRPNLVQMEND